MDPSNTWFPPEQEGPAKLLWLRIWQTQQELDRMNVNEGDIDIESFTNVINNQNTAVMNGKSDKSNNILPRRRRVDNRASTRFISRNPQKIVGEYGGCPWRQEHYNYGKGIIGLHQEIEHFYAYMSPSELEHKIRGDVVQRIKRIIVSKWPEAQVEIFGSYRTGLYLPTSDIDLVVIGEFCIIII
ncbi:hypothetical protein WA026_013313 [Henosepilachna vigintioctopunctata]|uniref:Poly(A) RNA polymerase mitochondrial-like central palm domain-containing protein n=1 Tax=Henosepilachna vigintioctopunctata TaxID=420089 RepID=A0AAW1VD30_9CUCU